MTLVTGGTGFIGSHLVEALQAHGDAVRCLIRRAAVFPTNVETVRGDLVSGAGIPEALRGVDRVIHLAGVTKALSDGDYYDGNVRGTENLARAIAGSPIRLVHVSSLSAVGPSSAVDAPVNEDTEPHPVSEYGRSKLEGERVARKLVPNAAVVRPPVVYGPRDTDVFQVFKSVNRGFTVNISGGEQWFQAIYVKDLVKGLIEAAQNPRAAGRTYFIAYPKPASLSELVRTAGGVMHQRVRAIQIPTGLAYAAGMAADGWSRITRKPSIISRDKVREARHRYWTCDARRAADELDFHAQTPLDQGIAQTLAWYKEAGWLDY